MATFALFFGITSPLPGISNQKGIRCDTGAVPAAVSLVKRLFDPHATVLLLKDGKVIKKRASQNTCRDSLYYFLLSGKIAKVNCNSLLFIFSIKQKAGKLKRDYSVMEKVCPRCNESFECRNDQILECWCLNEPISSGLRKFLADHFSGCLCSNCINSLRELLIDCHHKLN